MSPQEVVEGTRAAGLNCISITDHDTFEGVLPTQLAAKEFDIEVIAGIEFSSEWEGKDIHILGYCMDLDSEALREPIKKMQKGRRMRIEQMIEKLKAQGINNIVPQEVFDLTQSDSVGRMHLATILKQKGWVSSIQQAFVKYIGEGCIAYVPKFKQTPQEIIALIRKARGVAVMAHPMLTLKDELIPGFVDAGLRGLEVYYPNCSQNIIQFYENIAKKHNLILTGGSDAHGKAKNNTSIGKMKISYELVERLKEEKEKV